MTLARSIISVATRGLVVLDGKRMSGPKQTCPTCPNLQKCWATHTNAGKPVSTQNVLINILICRLQLNIDRNKAAENLLQLLRPGMVRLLSHVKQSGSAYGMDMDQLLQDMRSTTI